MENPPESEVAQGHLAFLRQSGHSNSLQICVSYIAFLTDGLLERTIQAKNRPIMAY